MAVTDASLRKESRDRYLTYALSVVTGRALPDVRDGLKPVQRRILYAMGQNLKLKPTASHRKSAAVVGEVLARFHPHGDVACYEAMVRMAQDFSMRYPLVDGQGNFGSLDGDGAAAYRYTEARLLEIALEVLGEIDQETVEFRDNFDATVTEPVVLPSRVPNLLINGASGIAVGMATSIPPHNLRDTIKALLELLDNPEVTISRLATIIKAPDFPTGCEILSTKKELNEIYKTGRGSIKTRGSWELEDAARGKKLIIVKSIPYALNKSQLVSKIANLIIDKKVPQLVDVRDESTSDVRIVLELASGADPEIAMAFIYKNTPLESNFAVNMTALTPLDPYSCKPELLSLKDCLSHFLDFREEVVRKKLAFEKKQLLERLHILEGLVKVCNNLDEAIKIVRKSEGRSDAAAKLRKRFKLTEIQSFAVVDMRIYQLSKTNIEELKKELTEKKKRVKEIEAILKSPAKIAKIIKSELEEVSKKYGDPRRSPILKDHIEVELKEDDYLVREEVFAIVTKDGWIKRIRSSNELGSTRLREGDSINQAHLLSTHDYVICFTNLGYMYSIKVADFPSSSGYGSPIQKILKFRDGEKIIESFGYIVSETTDEMQYDHSIEEGQKLLLVTENGMGFITVIEGLDSLKRNGKRVMKVKDGDALVAIVNPEANIAMLTEKGSGLQIKLKEIPVRSTAAVGVILMSTRSGDTVKGVVPFSKAKKINLGLSSGREKTISTSDIVKGRRGLKGNKVISRNQIVSVEYN